MQKRVALETYLVESFPKDESVGFLQPLGLWSGRALKIGLGGCDESRSYGYLRPNMLPGIHHSGREYKSRTIFTSKPKWFLFPGNSGV